MCLILVSKRILDSTGILLEAVSLPIKRYLRDRSDTIRCIALGFTDEDSELFEEFMRQGDEAAEGDGGSGGVDRYESDVLRSTWTPSPLNALLHAGGIAACAPTSHSVDIISMLVGIFGSADLFVQEYQHLLSERLLAIHDYDVDQELKNLEMLKLRFGEDLLQSCMVMIKDVTDSKRING